MKIEILLISAIIGMILVSGCTNQIPKILDQQPETKSKCYVGDTEVQCSEQKEDQVETEQPAETRTETYIPKPYKIVTEKPTGWFKTGQEADLILYATGFNESGGPLVLNHPTKIATDGRRLIISDTWNHRVLIWNEIPIKNNQQPDLVLGQPDFNSNIGRLSKDGLNWPMGVATDGKKLLIADAGNDRVLIWNSFPTRNGQPADLVLGVPDFDSWARYLDWDAQKEKKPSPRDPRKEINWPWDVWTDGERVVVASTTDSSVLIWNKFPIENNQPADIVLGHENFSMRFMDYSSLDYEPNPLVKLMTPRSIASDGNYLAIGMYGGYGMYVWKEFPEESGQPADFTMELRRLPDEPTGMVAGLTIDNGKLFSTSSHQVFIWNTLPMQETTEDLRVGRLDPKLDREGMAGPEGVATDGKRLFVADTYQNRVLIFNQISPQSGAKADIILGQPDFYTNIFSSRNSFPNPFPYSDGKRLFVCSDSRQGLAIYNNIPDESKAEADVIIQKWKIDSIDPAGILRQREGELGDCGQITSDGTKMIVAARGSGKVLIWNTIPTKDNELPDVILGNTTDLTQHRNGGGPYSFNSPVGATTDGKKLFISDRDNNRILIWNEIPTENLKSPDIVLGQPDFETYKEGAELDELFHPVQISTDGKRLVVADQFNNRILVWKKLPTKSQQPADFAINIIDHSKNIADLSPTARLSMPSGVYIFNGSLSVSDNGNNRVLVWSKFPESELDGPDIIIGQPDFESQYRTNSEDTLFMPHFITFDGSFLWVGEMKFSNRLLRFSVK